MLAHIVLLILALRMPAAFNHVSSTLVARKAWFLNPLFSIFY
jgi:hypothetical protein